MADSMTHFGNRLREQREAAGLSQYALAQRSGLSKQALSNLEMGAREPSWATVQKIVAALGVSCEEFMDPDLARLPEREPPRPVGRPRKEAPEETKSRRPRGRPRKGE